MSSSSVLVMMIWAAPARTTSLVQEDSGSGLPHGGLAVILALEASMLT
jgi:hypothetical protein